MIKERDRAADFLLDALLVRLADSARSAAARRAERDRAPEAPARPGKRPGVDAAAWSMIAQAEAARPELEAMYGHAAALKQALE